MNDKIITFAAEPPVTRWIYVKTVLIIFVATEVMNFFAQTQLVQKVDMKFSSIIAGVLSLFISYLLLRSPLTKSLTIDYAKRLVVVGFATLTKANNTLEISFERLGVKTDVSSEANSQIAKWKMWLLLDGKEAYLLLSGENGFTAEQLNEFKERVTACQETGKN